MAWSLAPHFSYGFAGDRCFALDLRRDRYFALSRAAAVALLELERGGDAVAAGKGLSELLAHGWIEAGGVHPIAPVACHAPIHSAIEMGARPTPRRIGALALGARLLGARARLASMRLSTVIAHHRRSRPPGDAAADDALVGMAQDARRARSLIPLRSACLPDALATALLLREHGYGAEVVLGVRLQPFAAHAWVQAQDLVLSDTVATVADFTPVLVL